MTSQTKARVLRVQAERMRRAKELMAYALHTNIEVGWDGPHTTFKPMDTDQRFIEEVTILSKEYKYLTEKLGNR